MNPLIQGFGLCPNGDGSYTVSCNGETVVFADAWALVEWITNARDEIVTMLLAKYQRPSLLN